jgi:hypothetical protein
MASRKRDSRASLAPDAAIIGRDSRGVDKRGVRGRSVV